MADNLPDVYLRFVDAGLKPEVAGETTDAAYPASDGWLAIKSFNFGFGWGGSGDSGAKDDAMRDLAKGKKLNPAQQKLVASHLKSQDEKDGKAGKKGGKTKEKEGTLVPKTFSFTRNPGVATIDLLAILRNGEEIEKAELIVCRAAGVDSPKGPKDSKIPFLRLLFELLHLKKCAVSVSKDQPPSESVEFGFKKVTMETIWTDNETGEKVPGSTLSVFFDFEKEKGLAHSQDYSWTEQA